MTKYLFVTKKRETSGSENGRLKDSLSVSEYADPSRCHTDFQTMRTSSETQKASSRMTSSSSCGRPRSCALLFEVGEEALMAMLDAGSSDEAMFCASGRFGRAGVGRL